MTIDEAIRIITSAVATDPASVNVFPLFQAIAVLRERAFELDDESERERAMWMSANVERPPYGLKERIRRMSTSDLRSLTRCLEDYPLRFKDVISLVESAGTLREFVDALTTQLTQDRGRWSRAIPEVQQRRVEGHMLVRKDDGQYFLNGTVVREGTQLNLLTTAGWMEGRYHIGGNGQPMFIFCRVL